MGEVAVTADEINNAHRLARESAETAVEIATRCGQLLIEKKKEIAHGEWQKWVELNCDFSYQSAAIYMKAARQKSNALDFSSLRSLYGPDKKGPQHIPRTTPNLPSDRFSLIYADPPWRYEFAQSDSRRVENQYPTMDVETICGLPVPEITADDCVLFLWTTSPKLPEALEVIAAWGFGYRTSAVWTKPQLGMGFYFRQQHEFLLVATKGSPGVPEPDCRVRSVMEFPRTTHSVKPREYYEIIEQMYPDAKRIELFCREPRDGWAAWGNEVAA